MATRRQSNWWEIDTSSMDPFSQQSNAMKTPTSDTFNFDLYQQPMKNPSLYNPEQDPTESAFRSGGYQAPTATAAVKTPEQIAAEQAAAAAEASKYGYQDITNPDMFKFMQSPEYTAALAQANGAYTSNFAAMEAAAKAAGAAQTPWGSLSGNQLAAAQAAQAQQAQFQGYGNAPTMDAAAFNQNQYMQNFLANQGNLAQISQDRTSALGQSLEAVAARKAALGGEAALAAMPGARNSGAGMAAFGEAYATPFAEAQAQQQAAQLQLYGNLAGQSMGQYGSNSQFGSSLQQQANQNNQQMVGQYGLASGNMANQVNMQNAQLGTNANLQNAQLATNVSMQNASQQANWSLQEKASQQAALDRQAQLAQIYGGLAGNAMGNATSLAGQGAQWYNPTVEYKPTPEEEAQARRSANWNTILQAVGGVVAKAVAIILGKV